jgi:Do/DeqQ family serine protease
MPIQPVLNGHSSFDTELNKNPEIKKLIIMNSNQKHYLITAAIALLVSTGSLGLYHWIGKDNGRNFKIEHINAPAGSKAVFTLDENGNAVNLDFRQVAAKVMSTVVHIKSTNTSLSSGNKAMPDQFRDFFEGDPFREFFGPRFNLPSPDDRSSPQLRVGTGSGVIINDDGYIVTNNHVVEDADDIEITLHDNRTFKATVIGTDPSTDIALMQIKEKGLPYLPFVNSDEVQVGEWVLAVGNPFNLTSTVTAGIVSAKGRNINILREQFAVESFIQTDAAINPGNSGGALVNLQGGLIGINTAIASTTGTYAGYGFAVPANIVSKVVEDLMQFGVVQRGVLGVTIRTVDGNLAREKDLKITEGAYVDSLLENSAAKAAGIKAGDVIIAINDAPVKSSPMLQELIARHRPGDKVQVKVLRNGSEKTIPVVLNNRNGESRLVSKERKDVLNLLGASFETLKASDAKKLGIQGGVILKSLSTGKLRKETQIREGFIITKVNGEPVYKTEDLSQKLENKSGGIMLEGIYQDIPGTYYYAFGLQ